MSNALISLAGRVLLAAVFIPAGLSKFGDISATAGMITGAGWPQATALAYAAAAFEVIAGVCVLIGFQTRIAAIALAAFCVVTALVFHNGAINMPGFSPEANGMLSMFNQIMMFKNLGLAGGFLALAAAGAGAWSVDAKRGLAAA